MVGYPPATTPLVKLPRFTHAGAACISLRTPHACMMFPDQRKDEHNKPASHLQPGLLSPNTAWTATAPPWGLIREGHAASLERLAT